MPVIVNTKPIEWSYLCSIRAIIKLITFVEAVHYCKTKMLWNNLEYERHFFPRNFTNNKNVKTQVLLLTKITFPPSQEGFAILAVREQPQIPQERGTERDNPVVEQVAVSFSWAHQGTQGTVESLLNLNHFMCWGT